MKPQMKYLKDYKAPAFTIEHVYLHFELGEEETLVDAVIKFTRTGDKKAPLELTGEAMELKKVLLNGEAFADYEVTGKLLTLKNVPDDFTLETQVVIKPQENTRLSGLYKSSGNFCTQCESHGFRRITYFYDRPDILTQYTVSISADKNKYPILLSNGNLVEERDLKNNRHWVKWEDPSRKPSYLFALVAGDFDHLKDTFKSMSGREIALHVYVEKGKADQATHAMHSLQKAMKWDEETFGREYDLDQYMIVAVSDFNFGAMENKGLNIFNDKYILAKAETATDDDYVLIEEVIGHEYFHNWSGNRITLRDWFQITLKEGLTVFRDQSFTEDVCLGAVKRIEDARIIRDAQFAQDKGPMAHPIRPDHYIEVNNFYTVTVYNKGAEVIRMIQTMLGKETFRHGMDHYFEKFDGQAVTTEDFVDAMQHVASIDLTQFKNWYSQAGTPLLTISGEYREDENVYALTVKQTCSPTPGQKKKEPFHIPLAIGLLDKQGNDMQVNLKSKRSAESTFILDVKRPEEVFEFVDVSEKPTPSLLRHFSAPVEVEYEYSDDELSFLMKHDSDDFARWDAGQALATREMLRLLGDHLSDNKLQLSNHFVDAYRYLLTESALSPIMLAHMLGLPKEFFLLEKAPETDVHALHQVREFVKASLAKTLQSEFTAAYQHHHKPAKEHFSVEQMGERRLKNSCLFYLCHLSGDEGKSLAYQQFEQSKNMTDTMGALTALNNIDCQEREQAMQMFYQHWQHEHLVVDKWLSLHAWSFIPGRLHKIQELMSHEAYQPKNPNRVRALIGTFCVHNLVNFHQKDGAGYEFLAKQILEADSFNPQLASRLLEPFTHWRKYDPDRQAGMQKALQAIQAHKDLSTDVFEVVEKSLG